ncbi:MAG: hypothetical protein QOF48_316 [Verrucomicrobiota bacterium]
MKANPFIVFLITALFLHLTVAPARANGTETLGAPLGITLSPGSGLAIGSVGLEDNPSGRITVTVPAAATVQQVLLYWQGISVGTAGDNAIRVNGRLVTGSLVGGPTLVGTRMYVNSYRANITALNMVAPGVNQLEISDLAFTDHNAGAGVVVIYDSSPRCVLRFFDGNDFALRGLASPLQATVGRTFTFPSSSQARQATLSLLTGISGDDHSLIIVVNGITNNLVNPIPAGNRAGFAALQLPVQVPAGVSSVSVRLASGDGTDHPQSPAALSWVLAALCVAQPLPASAGPQIVLVSPSAIDTCGSRDRKVTIQARVSDPTPDTLRVDLEVNSVIVQTRTVLLTAASTNALVTFSRSFPAGISHVRLIVTDSSGLEDVATLTVDSEHDITPPVLICAGTRSKTANPHGWATLPHLSAHAYDNCTPKDELTVVQSPHPGTKFSVGTHPVTFTVTDRAGNQSTCQTTFTVRPRHKEKED